ncbi:hypothetical protein TNIN_114351 [Trichonephila inaurata madagascariensis]|uniref:Uncharacterized protein n=1 Tax=Trichonephila inaurata madagascariensis TaxID=2747483 RepID=A0A8X6IRT2_9ARAC|nr:hypothetical protein TNIN_114351 [Trichonephila inaurata madagascariensis]
MTLIYSHAIRCQDSRANANSSRQYLDAVEVSPTNANLYNGHLFIVEMPPLVISSKITMWLAVTLDLITLGRIQCGHSGRPITVRNGRLLLRPRSFNDKRTAGN